MALTYFVIGFIVFWVAFIFVAALFNYWLFRHLWLFNMRHYTWVYETAEVIALYFSFEWPRKRRENWDQAVVQLFLDKYRNGYVKARGWKKKPSIWRKWLIRFFEARLKKND